MWKTILSLALKYLLPPIINRYVKPWLEKLQEDKKFQRAVELAGPLVEMAERGDLAELTDKTKRDAVKDNLRYQLKQEGIELKEYLLNNAIEAVVAALTEEGKIN